MFALASDPTTGVYDTSAVGTGKTVTVSGLTLTGAKAADYIIASVVSGPIGVIASVPITVTTPLTADSPVLAGFAAALTSTTPVSTPLLIATPPPDVLTPVTVASISPDDDPPSLADQATSAVVPKSRRRCARQMPAAPRAGCRDPALPGRQACGAGRADNPRRPAVLGQFRSLAMTDAQF